MHCPMGDRAGRFPGTVKGATMSDTRTNVVDPHRLATLTEHAEVRARWMSALWYGYGMADSGAFPGLTLDDAMKFAEEQALAAREFYVNHGTGLDSILRAWDEFTLKRGLVKARSVPHGLLCPMNAPHNARPGARCSCSTS